MVQPPPPPQQPSPQQHQQFLSTVLSQRGPSSLPYNEDVKWLIRQHLISLTEAYPSMSPKTAVFTHNDGRSVNLLQSEGTVPMVYQNVTYNIPVVIWLMETYPRYAPAVYVNPTRDMVIKRQHPFVNPNGLVVVSYLQNWVYPSSNLLDLCRNLSHYFGLDPPLYSNRRPNPNPSVNVNVNPNLNHNPSFSNVSVRPAIPPRSYPPSPYGGGRISPSLSSNSLSGNSGVSATEDPAEVYRRNVINKLVESVHSDVEELRKKREVEMEGMLSAQNVLRIREEEVNKGLREMREEKEGLEQQLQMVLMNTDVLEAWVKENEGKLSGGGVEGVSGDEVFEPVDGLSKQMLECTASDLAIEDVIYALDKAVQEGAIPVDVYLRNVRLLSREQFVHRATSMKVRAAQMQAQVTSMASRAPPYAV